MVKWEVDLHPIALTLELSTQEKDFFLIFHVKKGECYEGKLLVYLYTRTCIVPFLSEHKVLKFVLCF